MPQRLFRWLVFNLLEANDDCHLKNLSFLVQPGNLITLAPHYDILATGVYHTRSLAEGDGRWPHVEMAVRLNEQVQHFDAVTPAVILEAADILGVPRSVAQRVTRDVVNRTLKFFDQVYATHFPDEAGLLAKGYPVAANDEIQALAQAEATPSADDARDLPPGGSLGWNASSCASCATSSCRKCANDC